MTLRKAISAGLLTFSAYTCTAASDAVVLCLLPWWTDPDFMLSLGHISQVEGQDAGFRMDSGFMVGIEGRD